ncbi:hypothetical protein OBBRIDRAFT_888385 [Obba rivulosa]|uniref:Uncharacterized protein n=1 Tax=Obba rivulosa TaxID=1052685 RepID=A0A8E2AWP2_9APHY|nr:hypothetical protein OBBRIDRAFT_888385 [Obba rivulosa]
MNMTGFLNLANLSACGSFLVLLHNFLTSYDRSVRCIGVKDSFNTVGLLLFANWALFSAIRVYAVSGGSWWLASLVFLLNAVPVGTNSYDFFSGIVYQVESIPVIGTVCFIGSNISDTEIIQFAVATRSCVMAADILVLLAIWTKTYGTVTAARRSGIKTPLATTLLRDGTLYFLLLLAINILSIVGFSINEFVYAVNGFSTPLSSIIVSHFLLNLRQVSSTSQDGSVDISHTSAVRSQQWSLRFRSFIDNMGEDLTYGTDVRDLDPHMSWVEDEHGAQDGERITAIVEPQGGHGASSSNLSQKDKEPAVMYAGITEVARAESMHSSHRIIGSIDILPSIVAVQEEVIGE